MTRARRTLLPCAALALLCGAMPGWGQATPGPAATGPGIYTCIDGQGRRLTSDRPIAECSHREQRVLNRDGSVQRVIPPTMTAEERAERESAERRAELARAAQADAVRRDRNLVARYPNEATHRKAREAALDTVRLAMKATEQRLRELADERKPLLDEAEFYKDKPLPAKLRQQIDANEAATTAQQDAQSNQKAELERVTRLFDAELARLKRLWAGAPPGSLGAATVEATSAPSPAAPTGKPVAVRIDKK